MGEEGDLDAGLGCEANGSICCIVWGQNYDLGWWLLLSIRNDAEGITLKDVVSHCYLGHLSNKLPRVSCISGTFCGAPREKVRSYKLFLEYLVGSGKIQKYVSVWLISSRGAIALLHPKLSYLWWRRCLATVKPSSLSPEDTPLTSLVKKCTCTYMQYNQARGCLPAHAPSSLVMDKERLLYPPDMAP